jgi:hypothetical protein
MAGKKRTNTTSDRDSWSSPNAQTTVLQSRVPIFRPIGKITHNSKIRDPARPAKIRVETSWGWAELEGPPLIQAHRDILIGCLVLGEESLKKWDTGEISVWVNLYALETLLGRPHGGNNRKELMGYIKDLRDVSLTVADRNGRYEMTSGILSRYGFDEETAKAGKPTGSRIGGGHAGHLYEVRFSVEYMRFFRSDLRVHMKQAAKECLGVSSPLLRALILFFLTHEGACAFPLDTVLKTIGALPEGLDKSNVSRIRSSVRKQEDLLLRFGIALEGDVLRYGKKHEDVFFKRSPAGPEKSCGDISPTTMPAGTLDCSARTGAAPEENPAPEPIVEKSSTGAVLHG